MGAVIASIPPLHCCGVWRDVLEDGRGDGVGTEPRPQLGYLGAHNERLLVVARLGEISRERLGFRPSLLGDRKNCGGHLWTYGHRTESGVVRLERGTHSSPRRGLEKHFYAGLGTCQR